MAAGAPRRRTPTGRDAELGPAAGGPAGGPSAGGTAAGGTAAGGPSAGATAAGGNGALPHVGAVDLAGSLRGLLRSVDDEVRAVGELSERIDEHVTTLNELRAEQAARLAVLDELRASVQDESLGAFLDKAVRPRGARVEEVVPERLVQP